MVLLYCLVVLVCQKAEIVNGFCLFDCVLEVLLFCLLFAYVFAFV